MMTGNWAKAISSPLVGEDKGGGSRRTSKALFRPLLGDRRATPHPRPHIGRPEGRPSLDGLWGAGARRTVARFTSPDCPWAPQRRKDQLFRAGIAATRHDLAAGMADPPVARETAA